MSKRKRVNDMKYHYTYRITNVKEGMYYYGVHSCNCLPDEEIGIIYFSSSKNKAFIKDQKENPQNYKYKVIKQFNTRSEANYHEEILHAKFNVKDHKRFYNKHNACCKFDSSGMTTALDKDGNKYYISNKDPRFLSGELISAFCGKNNGMFSKKRTPEELENISIGTKKGILAANYKGHPVDEQTRKQIAETLTGRIFVSKDGKNVNIYPEELDFYLSQGYERKMIKKGNYRIRVYSEEFVEGILIEQFELEEYLNNGYYQKKKVTMTKDGKCKSILETDIQEYIDYGWERGIKIVRKSGIAGTKAMHIPGENKVKYIKPEDFEKYLDLGYTFEPLKRK